MDWVISIICGLFSGFAVSILLFLIRRIIKPKLTISKQIAREKGGENDTFRVKVINKSKFEATNLRYCLKYSYRTGDNKYTVIVIDHKQMFYNIKPLKNSTNYSDNVKIMTFFLKEENYPLYEDSKFIFEIFSEHSFSGYSKCFTQTFSAVDIIDGKFKEGQSTAIIPN